MQYWPVLFAGKDVKGDDGVFKRKMGPGLRRAVEKLADKGVFNIMGKTMQEIWGSCHNLILHGPPGTGKTYHTVIYAVAICEGLSAEEVEEQARKDYGEVLGRYHKLKGEGRISFTTFHQSYGYEEFIEGIKPVMGGGPGGLGYRVEPGVFKRFCDHIPKQEEDPFEEAWNQLIQDARSQGNTYMFTRRTGSQIKAELLGNDVFRVNWDGKKPSYNDLRKEKIREQWENKKYEDRELLEGGTKWLFDAIFAVIDKLVGQYHLPPMPVQPPNYVFIIDEINRGNISKIFGELITLIEDKKRLGGEEAMEVVLPYSGEKFGVPGQVYIIGTMNTADRSIALMDTALRRRFQFIEKMPDMGLLDGVVVEDRAIRVDVREMAELVNKRIEFLYDREHTIGHAFFLPLKETPSMETLRQVFRNSIVPLLQEYFYEDYEKIQQVLGDDGKEDKFKFILDSTAKPGRLFRKAADYEVGRQYRVQEEAFGLIESYRGILSDG